MQSCTEHAALSRPRVKSKPHGNASSAPPVKHSNNPMSGSAPFRPKKSARSRDERPACPRVVAEHRSIGVFSGFRVIDKQRSNKWKKGLPQGVRSTPIALSKRRRTGSVSLLLRNFRSECPQRAEDGAESRNLEWGP